MQRRGFIQNAVRRAIAACGGIVPAASALGYSDSHVGRWNSQTERSLPDLEQALALDDLTVSCGGRAELLHAMAASLGHVVFRLPEGFGETEALTVQLVRATSEFGDIAGVLIEALGDGKVDSKEAGRIAHQIDEAMVQLGVLRALVIEEERAFAKSASVRHVAAGEG